MTIITHCLAFALGLIAGARVTSYWLRPRVPR
jgi:hypothetical protein